MSDGKTLEESFSDKANDTNVVHKSGDEEILGRKTFDDLRANGFCLSDEGDWNRWVSAFYSFLKGQGIIQFGTEEDWSVILRNLADPEYDYDAATKNYVDTKISSTEENLVHKNGYERITERKQFQKGIGVGLFNTLVANEDGVQSGAWLDQNEDPAPFIVADPSADDHAATKYYVDEGLATKQNTLTDTDGGYGQRVANLEKTKQDTLTAGNGISIEGNKIGVTEEISSKQDAITDLETIRSNATNGNEAAEAIRQMNTDLIYKHRTMAEAIVSVEARVAALESSRSLLGEATAGRLDVTELTTYLYPRVLYGHGVPSASVVPDNLPAGLPWDGVPVFIGQLYINLDATSSGLYYAKGHDSVSDWKQA